MFDPKIIDEIATKLNNAIPPGAKAIQQDLHAQFKQVLQSMLGKMDLVTRDEFDVQTKVLARTRQKIEELEKLVAAIEDRQRQADNNVADKNQNETND